MAKALVSDTPKQEKSHSLHPPYSQMICEAISTLKERTGSSTQAIAKVIENNHGKHLPPNFKNLLSIQLRRLVKTEKLIKVKNSFKISKKKTSSVSVTKKAIAKKVTEKAMKTKRLSQVQTPEALKKKKKVSISEDLPKFKQLKSRGGKVKRNSTPMKRKM